MQYWFGGLCCEYFDGFELLEMDEWSGKDMVLHRQYRGARVELSEMLVYKDAESTLVQKKFLITDYVNEFRHRICLEVLNSTYK